MQDLLFLAHRIPYPPNKGDKIRAWHLLDFLSRHYRIHLGAFVDDPEDWRYVEFLRGRCASTCLIGLDPKLGKLRSLTGLLTGQPLTLPYYRHTGMQRWVDVLLSHGMARILVYSSAMARFVMTARHARRVMDFVDVDSDKWRQYALTKPWPVSWLYRREGGRLLDWERKVAAEFDASLFVSAREAEDFRSMAPECATRVGHYNNGVDAGYFSPDRDYADPYPEAAEAIVFTGAMDYWPNIDAVKWFAAAVLPELLKQRPNLLFAIVGSRPGGEVSALASRPGVLVTGRVDDVRPYLAHARAVVAPLRIARGIQNKVLEGMAMARTVVGTPQALEGIEALPGKEIRVAEDAAGLVRETLLALEGPDLGGAARARVQADFSWETNLAEVERLLEG